MTQIDRFIKYLESLTEEQKNKINNDNLLKAEIEFNEFKKQLDNGTCHLCGSPIRNFNENKPCLHWLLKPKSIKKHHYKKLFESALWGYMRINTYVRWVANTERSALNINNIDSTNQDKVIEETITYKDLEWSFSCGANDFIGHTGANAGSYPHFHMQLRQNGFPQFRFNDFHIPLLEEDLEWFEFIEKYPDGNARPFTEGLSEVFSWVNESEENSDSFLNSLKNATSEESADINLSTIVMAPKGKSMSGEDIYNIIQRAQSEGIPMAQAFRDAPEMSDARITTFGEPGNNTPELSVRTPRKSKA